MRRPTRRGDLRLPLFVVLAGAAGLRTGMAAPAAPPLVLAAAQPQQPAAIGPVARAAFAVG